jgi:hypothetical protein
MKGRGLLLLQCRYVATTKFFFFVVYLVVVQDFSSILGLGSGYVFLAFFTSFWQLIADGRHGSLIL